MSKIRSSKNAVDEYKKRKGEYEKVQNSPKTADNYVGSDFKAIIHYKKRKGDQAVPSNAPHLMHDMKRQRTAPI
jgi:hypothetical protein